MRRKTQVWILVMWILGQILSTICIEKKYADPMQNVTISQRYKRSGNIFTYFSNLDNKVIITRRYDNDKAHKYMRFSGRRVVFGNKLVTKLTCDLTHSAQQLISSGVSGILILHKRHQETTKFTKVVGLSSDANIMFNKRINWKMKMNQKSIASRTARQHLGYVRLDYHIPGDKCHLQAGLFYCQIYGKGESKQLYRLQLEHGVSKSQCTATIRGKPKTIKPIKPPKKKHKKKKKSSSTIRTTLIVMGVMFATFIVIVVVMITVYIIRTKVLRNKY